MMGCAVLVTMLGVVLLALAVIVTVRVQDRVIERDEHEDGGP